jgi:hypothetical protein
MTNNDNDFDTIAWAQSPDTTIDQLATEIRVTRRAYRFAKGAGDLLAMRDLASLHLDLMTEYRRRILNDERQNNFPID